MCLPRSVALASSSEAPSSEGVSLFDLASGVVAGYLRDGRSEITRAEGGSGRLVIEVVLNLDEQAGAPTWSRGHVFFERRREYRRS